MSDNNFTTSESLSESEVPRKVMMLANVLARIHGEVIIRNEAHGLHLYMASPIALERDGSIELQSKHLTVNADKHLGLGQFRNKIGTYNKEAVGKCHKYDVTYTVTQLKQMPPLEKRGIKDVSHKVRNNAVDREKYLIDDGKGNRIPMHPGLVTPIQDLPDDHAVIEYLNRRNYSIDTLVRQFRTSYCFAETPEQKDIKLYYRRLPGGFKDTPQGRVIFHIDVKGVQEGWQARILEKIEGDKKYFWHPYQNEWVLGFIKLGEIWQLRPDWQKEPYPWKPSKYRTGNGTQRSRVVMGYDAAVDWNERVGTKEPFAILVEGPLDAARFGPPGIAFLGKYLNEEQGKLIARKFKKVIYITDSDASGLQSKKSIIRSLAGKVDLHEAVVPKGVKDVGEMMKGDAWGLIRPFL